MHYALQKTDSIHQRRIIEYFRQVETLFTRFIDTDQIRLVNEAIDAVEANTFTIRGNNDDEQSASIYGAFAAGINVYLNMHSDVDYTYCAISIHQREEYLESQNVVAYFAFPRLGIAIPLRPGDILFFNPKEWHCVSSRCDNDEEIFCMSLFLKSANIGKNDNSMTLMPDQVALLSQYKK